MWKTKEPFDTFILPFNIKYINKDTPYEDTKKQNKKFKIGMKSRNRTTQKIKTGIQCK